MTTNIDISNSPKARGFALAPTGEWRRDGVLTLEPLDGYNAWAYVPGLTHKRTFSTKEHAQQALDAVYLGPDTDGVEPVFAIVPVID